MRILIALLLAFPAFGIGLQSHVFVAVTSGASVEFSPEQVDGLQFWFKGDTFTEAEGSAISNWVNSASQTGWYVTNQTSTEWPQLTNNFNGTGRKALRFDGSNDRLWVSNSAALNVTRNTNDCAIISIARVNDTAVTKTVFFISKGDSAASGRESLDVVSSEALRMVQRSKDADGFTSATDGTPTLTTSTICAYAEYTHTNKVDVTGSSLVLFTNNVQAFNASGASPTNTEDTASLVISMAAGSGQIWNGEIAEVLVYVPKPSAANRTSIYNYLKAKYSLVP